MFFRYHITLQLYYGTLLLFIVIALGQQEIVIAPDCYLPGLTGGNIASYRYSIAVSIMGQRYRFQRKYSFIFAIM